jgi:hypothetical protein
MPNTLKALWSGDFPLGQAFSHYAIAYGIIANILAQAAAIAAVLACLPAAVTIGLHFLPLSLRRYGCRRRLAQRRRGRDRKTAVIVWGALMVFV